MPSDGLSIHTILVFSTIFASHRPQTARSARFAGLARVHAAMCCDPRMACSVAGMQGECARCVVQVVGVSLLCAIRARPRFRRGCSTAVGRLVCPNDDGARPHFTCACIGLCPRVWGCNSRRASLFVRVLQVRDKGRTGQNRPPSQINVASLVEKTNM